MFNLEVSNPPICVIFDVIKYFLSFGISGRVCAMGNSVSPSTSFYLVISVTRFWNKKLSIFF